MKRYSQYTEDDFIMDANFQNWVRNPSTESETFWHNFLEQYPAKRPELDRAREMLLAMVFNNNLLPSETNAMWQKIASETVLKQPLGKVISLNKKNLYPRKLLYATVAVFAGCALILTVFYFNKTAPQHHVATQFGQVSKVLLPDNSMVALNARSTLKYNSDWNGQKPREVWVDGEAFFSVKHTSTNQPFIVHIGDLDIEVLGTEFNVMHREGRAKVSLNSGKIKLQVRETSEPVFMAPGDILEVASSKVIKKPGNVEHLSVWKEKKLIFDDTPLSEIMTKMKYIYGWEYEKVDEDLLVEKLSGEVETADETKLIHTLEKALRIVIRKKGNTVSISRM